MDREWGKLRILIIKKKLKRKAVTAICSEAQTDKKCSMIMKPLPDAGMKRSIREEA